MQQNRDSVDHMNTRECDCSVLRSFHRRMCDLATTDLCAGQHRDIDIHD